MEQVKIIFLCVVAAVVYGVLHDQVTARVCVEYFTVFHPPVFRTRSPTLLGLGWGVIATWWVGLFLGLILTLAARAGSRPKLTAAKLVRPIGRLLMVMACCAFAAGVGGFLLARSGRLPEPEWMNPGLSSSMYPRYVADLFAHVASYAVGFLGGLVLCVFQYRKRGLSAI